MKGNTETKKRKVKKKKDRFRASVLGDCASHVTDLRKSTDI